MLLCEFFPKSIRNANFSWTKATASTKAFYCRTSTNGNANLHSPYMIGINGIAGTKSTAVASLSSLGGWAYGDFDTLGYDTVYVRLPANADPDTKAVDYIAYLEYISQEGIALTHMYDAQISKFDNVEQVLAKPYGGHCKIGYGSMSISPGFFSTNYWPPVRDCRANFFYAASTEATRQTVFKGTAQLTGFSKESVDYDLYDKSLSGQTTAGTTFNTSLFSAINSMSSSIGLTASSSAARNPSPNAHFSLDNARNTLELMSDVAAFYTHMFVIDSTTLYLIDMFTNNSSRVVTPYDFSPSNYEYNPPISNLIASSFAAASTYPYGQEETIDNYHVSAPTTHLQRILTIMHSPKCYLTMPFTSALPTPGEKIKWTDTGLAQNSSAWIRTRSIRYDFENEIISIEGEGAISLAT